MSPREGEGNRYENRGRYPEQEEQDVLPGKFDIRRPASP